MIRKAYTGERASSSGPYSHAIDGGDYVFLSGQTARNTIGEGKSVISIGDQTEECFNNLIDVLKQANLTLDNVMKVNVYLTSMKDFAEMNAVYERKFNKPFPARTCVAVYELPLGANVEIEVIAKK